MRVVLDSIVFANALLMQDSEASRLIRKWREGKINLVTAEPQLSELLRAMRSSPIGERLNPSAAEQLVNSLRGLCVMVKKPRLMDVLPNMYDNYLLAIAHGGAAGYLVTDDEQDLLALKKYEGTEILSVNDFLAQTGG